MTAIPVDRASHWLLGGADGAPALIHDDVVVTYGELRERVDAERERLGPRHLVALPARPDVEFVVSYLAALAGGHPVIVLGDGDLEQHAELLEAYPPGTTAGLHPDLALLLSTSGSTGSPKLVRLSRSNVLANARSIADYLELRHTDVAATTLPLHYCYGLSVLHSHLLIGATVVLTTLSVADDCFWELAERAAVTGLAGVPHTYALLEAANFADRALPRLPSLRYLTQAGGRMSPDRVVDFAQLLNERGVDLFVMYGQTEATARIAYLPPGLAVDHPGTIGVPVPGGALRIDPLPGRPPGTGELVYTGPNVMMGYAHCLADLARGPELNELRTGDLARVTDAGLFEVMGRLDRHAKVQGHRVDLDRLEALLGDALGTVRLVARPDRLWVFVTAASPTTRVRDEIARRTGLRGGAVRVVTLKALPVTASGKPDEQALQAHVDREELLDDPQPAGPLSAEEVRDLYAVVLGRPDATVDDTFVGLGGDSLSYVEVSTRLGARLGSLPPTWPSEPATVLASLSAQPGGPGTTASRRRGVPVDISVLLRAVAITLVVVSHVDLLQLQGGAHVLLAVSGYNLARFQLAVPDREQRVRGLLRGACTIALPVVLFVGALAIVGHQYDWSTALLLNGVVGSDQWDDQWQFWFLETLVWCYVALAALVALPASARALRASPFACALVLFAVTSGIRYAWTGVEAGPTERYTTGVVAWCLALGLCAAYARGRAQRLLVTVLAVVSTVGFFGDPRREAIVIAGTLLLVLGAPLRLPARLASAVSMIAAASLWIYLTHWQVYPYLEDSGHRGWAIVVSLAVGIAAWFLVESARRRWRSGRLGSPATRRPRLG